MYVSVCLWLRKLTPLQSFWQVKLEITISTVNLKQTLSRLQTVTHIYIHTNSFGVYVQVVRVTLCETLASILLCLFSEKQFPRIAWTPPASSNAKYCGSCCFCYSCMYAVVAVPLLRCENCVALQHVCYLFDIWLRFVIGGAFINDTCVQAFNVLAMQSGEWNSSRLSRHGSQKRASGGLFGGSNRLLAGWLAAATFMRWSVSFFNSYFFNFFFCFWLLFCQYNWVWSKRMAE